MIGFSFECHWNLLQIQSWTFLVETTLKGPGTLAGSRKAGVEPAIPRIGKFGLKVIEPLEKAIAPAYDKSAFEYFAKLHGLDRRVGE